MSSDIGLAEVGPGRWICGGAYLHVNMFHLHPYFSLGVKQTVGLGRLSAVEGHGYRALK